MCLARVYWEEGGVVERARDSWADDQEGIKSCWGKEEVKSTRAAISGTPDCTVLCCTCVFLIVYNIIKLMVSYEATKQYLIAICKLTLHSIYTIVHCMATIFNGKLENLVNVLLWWVQCGLMVFTVTLLCCYTSSSIHFSLSKYKISYFWSCIHYIMNSIPTYLMYRSAQYA